MLPRHTFIPLLCLLATSTLALPIPARAQDYDQLIAREVRSLRAEKIDTVLWFSVPDYNFFSHPDSIDGIGYDFIFQASYLFYARDHRLYAKKILNYQDDSTGAGVPLGVCSSEQAVDTDSLCRWLSASWDTLKNCRALPFIYQYENGNELIYEWRHPDHPPYYGFCFYTGSDSSFNGLAEDDCDSLMLNGRPDSPVNLNYTYNIHTPLYFLFTHLLQYHNRYGQSFRFKRHPSDPFSTYRKLPPQDQKLLHFFATFGKNPV